MAYNMLNGVMLEVRGMEIREAVSSASVASLTVATSTISSNSPSPTTSVPPLTTSQASSSGGGGGGPQSSPLLFFVALGFGVVFTNLWIIVGVKYCFRYNARNRALRQNPEGEHIDMSVVPRTHRRRREKKLMSMDEVNERFPLTKYKTWINGRAAQGLSTAGGVAAPPSRAASMKAASVKEAERAVTTQREMSPDEVENVQATENTSDNPSKHQPSEIENAIRAHDHASHKHTHAHTVDHESKSLVPTTTVEDEDMDDDEHILNAVPTAMLENPGDSCAICIDTLDDDDEVRGLSCGHAFHASCIDPWLTSRRACCPLCKADYYVPKPRSDGESGSNPSESGDGGARSSGRRHHGSRAEGMPAPPQFAFLNNRAGHLRGRMVVGDRWMLVRHQGGQQHAPGSVLVPRVPRLSRRQRNEQQAQGVPNDGSAGVPDNGSAGVTQGEAEAQEQPRRSWRSRLVPRSIPTPRLWNRTEGNVNATTEAGSSPEIHGTVGGEPTPGQLEAGRP